MDEEIKNHKTIQSLFDVAFCLIDGGFGMKLRDRLISEIPYQLSWNTILILMLVLLSKSDAQELPEIFDQFKDNPAFEKHFKALKTLDLNTLETAIVEAHPLPTPELFALLLQLKPSNQSVLLKLFYNFIDHLVNPSYLLIDLLIHKKYLIDQTIETALKISNPVDRSKSLELLILSLLDNKEIEKALSLWKLIPKPQEKFKASLQIADKLIELDKIDEALRFTNEIKEPESHDQLLREASLRIAKHHLLNKALEVMETIQDGDIKSYTQSNLVHILCSQFDFPNAKKIALGIREDGFKEDAIVDIVKNYLARRKYDEAIQFTTSLDNPHEKQKPAKLIETALKIQHEDDKVRKVRALFSSPKAAA